MGKLHIGNLQRNTAENIRRVHALFHQDGVLLCRKHGPTALGQLLHSPDGNRGTGDQALQEQAVIVAHLGLHLIPRRGLGNIIDFLGVKVLAHAAILTAVCLARLQDDDGQTLLILQNLDPLGMPLLVAAHTHRVGALFPNQQRIAGRVEGEPALHIQICLHTARTLGELSENPIQSGIGFFSLLFLPDLPPLRLGRSFWLSCFCGAASAWGCCSNRSSKLFITDYLSFELGFFLGLGGWCRVVFCAGFLDTEGSSAFVTSASFFRWA